MAEVESCVVIVGALTVDPVRWTPRLLLPPMGLTSGDLDASDLPD